MSANKVESYFPLRNEVVLQMCKVQPESKKLIISPDDTEAVELASTRWRVRRLGPTADPQLKVGQLVLLSGRVYKAFCKNLLADYLTVTWIGDEPFILVPCTEIDSVIREET